MATYPEQRFGARFLDEVVEFVTDEFGINDLFDEQQIADWLKDNAEDYGYVKEDDTNGI